MIVEMNDGRGIRLRLWALNGTRRDQKRKQLGRALSDISEGEAAYGKPEVKPARFLLMILRLNSPDQSRSSAQRLQGNIDLFSDCKIINVVLR
jgi:hypothetical protein